MAQKDPRIAKAGPHTRNRQQSSGGQQGAQLGTRANQGQGGGQQGSIGFHGKGQREGQKHVPIAPDMPDAPDAPDECGDVHGSNADPNRGRHEERQERELNE